MGHKDLPAFSFLQKENKGSPRSSPRRQQSTGLLHLDGSSPRANQKSPTQIVLDFFWQGHKDLNPEPTVLETAALPIELYPYLYERHAPLLLWWALRDSNPGLSGYEPEALTN